MTTKREPPQVLYADQPAALALGPFVSRLTLGIVEDGSDAPVPVISFSMPTMALLQMAKDIIQQIESPSFARGAARSLSVAAEQLVSESRQLDAPPRPIETARRKSKAARVTSADRSVARKSSKTRA
jgi:hypothetical protein